MHNQRKKVLITGANGYIGQRLVIKMLGAGYDINVLVRNSDCFIGNSRITVFQYDLSSLPSGDAFDGVSSFIHLAAITDSLASESKGVEVEAVCHLINCARSFSVKRFIFISSQTAKNDAPTSYGRIKWRVEQEVLAANGLVVRPGQVYGGKEQGLFGLLVKTVRSLLIIPCFFPAPMIQPIHVDDLAEGLLRMAELRELNTGIYSLASIDLISFSSFLSSMAKYRVRSFRPLFPVPLLLISLASNIIGTSLSDRSGLNRLKSLFALQPMNTADDLNLLALNLRPIHAGMQPSGDDRRRSILIEGNALLKYILKEERGAALLRRYVYAVETVRDGSALDLPCLFLKRPVLISLLDGRCWKNVDKGKEFTWRLDAATLLAEATIQGASSFMGSGRREGPLINLMVVFRAIVSEFFWRIMKVISYPFLVGILRLNREDK
jgi:NADH dehydrogenase